MEIGTHTHTCARAFSNKAIFHPSTLCAVGGAWFGAKKNRSVHQRGPVCGRCLARWHGVRDGFAHRPYVTAFQTFGSARRITGRHTSAVYYFIFHFFELSFVPHCFSFGLLGGDLDVFPFLLHLLQLEYEKTHLREICTQYLVIRSSVVKYMQIDTWNENEHMEWFSTHWRVGNRQNRAAGKTFLRTPFN